MLQSLLWAKSQHWEEQWQSRAVLAPELLRSGARRLSIRQPLLDAPSGLLSETAMGHTSSEDSCEDSDLWQRTRSALGAVMPKHRSMAVQGLYFGSHKLFVCPYKKGLFLICNQVFLILSHRPVPY